MFFKDLQNWDNNKLLKYRIIFYSLYAILTIIAPVIIISCNYNLFATVGNFKLTAVGLIVCVVIGTITYKFWTRIVNKIDEDNDKLRKLKYTLQCISAIAIPVFAIVILVLTKASWDLAYKVILSCLGCYCAGIVIDYMCIKHLDWLYDIRHEAKHKKLVASQEKYVK